MDITFDEKSKFFISYLDTEEGNFYKFIFINFICFLQGVFLTFVNRKIKNNRIENILLDILLKFIYYAQKVFNMLTLMTCNGYLILANVVGISFGEFFIKEKNTNFKVEEKMQCNIC